MGRWTKERHAQEAAKKAAKAAQEAEANPEQVEQVEEPQVRPAEPSRGNERDEAMEELVARRNPEPAPETVEPQPEPQPEPQAEPQPAAPVAEAAPEVPKAEPKVMVVDGKAYEVSPSEIEEAGGERAWRIERASKNRLEEANQHLKEIRRARAELETRDRKPEPTEDEFIESRLEALRYATPAEGRAALREILDREIAKVRIDPNQITTSVAIQVARDQASRRFGEEFSDVATNPRLMQLASLIENEKLAQFAQEQRNPMTVDWQGFYRGIGNEVRSIVVRQSQPASTPQAQGNPSPTPDKEARKASIVNLPVAGTRAELPKEDKPQTREEILNEMRSGRPA